MTWIMQPQKVFALSPNLENLQPWKKLTNCLGITQQMLRLDRKYCQIPEEKGQWINKWLTFSSFLHNMHQFGEMSINGLLHWRLSIVLIRLSATDQERVFTLGGIGALQTLPKGKTWSERIEGKREMNMDLEEKKYLKNTAPKIFYLERKRK